MTTVSTNDFRTQLLSGTYCAETRVVIFLSHGKGDSRRDVSYSTYKAGETVVIPETVNGFWYGLEPNGDMFSPEPAVLKTVKTGLVRVKANLTDPVFRTFQVREIGAGPEYLHPELLDWFTVPESWLAQIVWN